MYSYLCLCVGGGINERNIERILEQTSAKEFHCSARKSEKSHMEFQNTNGNRITDINQCWFTSHNRRSYHSLPGVLVLMGAALCSQEYSHRVADEQKLQRILMTAAKCWKIVT